MRWSSWVLSGGLFFATCAMAGSIEDTLSKSSALLKSGQPEKALQLCQELLVEYPHSARLLFSIGEAQAALAAEHLDRSERGRSEALFREANETFVRTAQAGSSRIVSAARYNAATCLVHLDAALDPVERYDDRLANLRTAVEALEDCVRINPEEERARKNLDYARYTLNRLLLYPPSESANDDAPPEAENPTAQAGVNDATTQIPGATATVVDGGTVVLRRPKVEESTR